MQRPMLTSAGKGMVGHSIVVEIIVYAGYAWAAIREVDIQVVRMN